MHSDDTALDNGPCDWRLLRLDATDPAGVAAHFSTTIGQPEREFVIAVLEDAIHCYQKYAFSGTRRGRRLFREVEIWLTKPDARAAISFEYICDVLGVDPDSIRRTLKRWSSEADTGRAVSLQLRPADGDVVAERGGASTRAVDAPRPRSRTRSRRSAEPHLIGAHE